MARLRLRILDEFLLALLCFLVGLGTQEVESPSIHASLLFETCAALNFRWRFGLRRAEGRPGIGAVSLPEGTVGSQSRQRASDLEIEERTRDIPLFVDIYIYVCCKLYMVQCILRNEMYIYF